MKEKINGIYDVSNVYEISVDIGDFNYLVIYGQHINGWFISILNWNVCTEAAQPECIVYNAERFDCVLQKMLSRNMLKKFDVAYVLAELICRYWESHQEGCKDG